MKDTKNMPVKVCKECGTINSVLKERCENCNSSLPDPTTKKLAEVESEIIILENRIAERAGQRHKLTAEEMNLLKVNARPYNRGYMFGIMLDHHTGTRSEKRRLKHLQRRLNRMKAKEENSSASDN